MRALLTAFSLALVLGSIGSANAQAQAWIEVRPQGGGYRVEMPGTPAISSETVNLPGGRSTQMIQAVFEIAEAAFFSSHADYPADMMLGRAPDMVLDNVMQGAAAGHTLRSQRRMTIGGHPGREYVVAQANGFVLVTRIVLVGNRLFQIIVVRSRVEVHPDTQKFLDSFALTAR